MNNVNKPKHYTQGRIECIEALEAATINKSGNEAIYVANIIKYLWRYEEKGGIEDVMKANWYLERLLIHLEDKIENQKQDSPTYLKDIINEL